MFLDGGRGAVPKILKAYMGEVVWPHPPEVERQGLYGHCPYMERKLFSMARVVIVLLRQ
jgi:hypothetical protein